MPTFTHTPTEKKVFFAHIPRTAGRYVDANLLWRNNFTWDELPLDTGKGVMTDLHGAEIAHWHKDIYEEHLNVKDVPNFSIVRNLLIDLFLDQFILKDCMEMIRKSCLKMRIYFFQ